MSRLRANQITNENANGAPNFPHGLTVTGIVTATTTSTTMPQIVVGSAVTANSQGIDVTGIVTATSFKGNGSALTGITQTTINSNADNRIITGSGTADTLNGESNVTYDGSTLQIATDANLEGFKIISSGDTYSDINISANRGSANNSIGRIKGLWNDTQVASIEFKTGADTSGKDDGEITFHTSNGGGTLDERVRIFQNGSVVIGSKAGEAGGNAKLAIDCQGLDINDGVGDASNYGLIFANDSNSDKANGIGFFNDSASTCGGYIVHQDKGGGNIGDLVFATSASSDTPVERLRINSDGQILIGASDYSGGGTEPVVYVSGSSGRMVKIHNTGTATCSIQLTNAATGEGEDQGFMLAALSSRAAYVNNAEPYPIYFSTNGSIRMTLAGEAENLVVGAQDGFNDYSTVSAPLQAYSTSGYSSNSHVLKGIVANTSYTEDGGGMFFLGARRSTTSSYTMAGWYTGDDSSSITSDRQFRFIADGNAYADGSWNGGGADYAEFFEWLDGNSSDEDRKGISVVLENGKIRAATGSDNTDNIIGVISANPVVVGDSASERWKEKWITDDFGDPVYEEYTITEWYDETKKEKLNYATDRIPSDVTVGAGSSVLSTDYNGNAFTRKKLNPSWDSTATYIPRKDRKEWDIVGLMGKLKVKSDQPIGTKWIKIREVSASVHEYLIR